MTEFGPAGIGSWSTPLDVAMAHLGVQETPGRPNRGPMIDQWLRFVGLEPDDCDDPGGYSWCAAFVSWCCDKGGRPIKKSPGARKLLLLNLALEVALDALMPGDVLVNLMAKGKGHVAFFVRREHGRIYTIDGNSNDAGSRNGRDVAAVDRPVDYWDRAFRPRAP